VPLPALLAQARCTPRLKLVLSSLLTTTTRRRCSLQDQPALQPLRDKRCWFSRRRSGTPRRGHAAGGPQRLGAGLRLWCGLAQARAAQFVPLHLTGIYDLNCLFQRHRQQRLPSFRDERFNRLSTTLVEPRRSTPAARGQRLASGLAVEQIKPHFGRQSLIAVLTGCVTGRDGLRVVCPSLRSRGAQAQGADPSPGNAGAAGTPSRQRCECRFTNMSLTVLRKRKV
jgi:hypothetical protein